METNNAKWAILIVTLFVFAGVGSASANENAELNGKSISQLSAGWWQWQEANYPGFAFGEGSVDCSLGQSGSVWYLGGSDGSGPKERECAVEGQKYLMFPLVNAETSNPDDWCLTFTDNDTDICSVGQKRQILKGIFDDKPAGIFNSSACDLQATVDGNPVGYTRAKSTPFPYDGDPKAVSDGFWAVLSPLPTGDHTIQFSGGICDLSSGESLFLVEVIYRVTVE